MTPTPFNPFENHKRVLEQKRAAITQMCAALEEYFTADLDAQIERFNQPTQIVPAFPGQAYQRTEWKPSHEDFIAACEKVTSQERALEEARQAFATLGEDGTEGAVRASLGMQMRFIEEMLESATRTRDAMQKQMEQTEEPEQPNIPESETVDAEFSPGPLDCPHCYGTGSIPMVQGSCHICHGTGRAAEVTE